MDKRSIGGGQSLVWVKVEADKFTYQRFASDRETPAGRENFEFFLSPSHPMILTGHIRCHQPQDIFDLSDPHHLAVSTSPG